MRFATRVVSACALAVLLTGTEALAQDHSHDAASGAPLVIEVNLADYSFSPEQLRIPAGQLVQLVFTNTGEVEHEFMAGRTVVDGDFAVDLFAGLEVEIGTLGAAVPEGHDNSDGHHDDDVDVPAGHDNSDGHHDGDAAAAHGTMISLQEGTRGTMTFTLPTALRGEWETGCFLTGHYGRGMHGTLTVY